MTRLEELEKGLRKAFREINMEFVTVYEDDHSCLVALVRNLAGETLAFAYSNYQKGFKIGSMEHFPYDENIDELRTLLRGEVTALLEKAGLDEARARLVHTHSDVALQHSGAKGLGINEENLEEAMSVYTATNNSTGEREFLLHYGCVWVLLNSEGRLVKTTRE